VKVAKAAIYRQVSSLPALKFEEQQLTSFAGLVVFQKLFETCQLKARLQEACAHLHPRHYYSFSTILQCLIVHLVLGYRQLRESAFYREDPLVKRVLGLKSLPSVATVSRMLSEFERAQRRGATDGQSRLSFRAPPEASLCHRHLGL
jgi:hypothetical protein